jgi:hypothetical protein
MLLVDCLIHLLPVEYLIILFSTKAPNNFKHTCLLVDYLIHLLPVEYLIISEILAYNNYVLTLQHLSH